MDTLGHSLAVYHQSKLHSLKVNPTQYCLYILYGLIVLSNYRVSSTFCKQLCYSQSLDHMQGPKRPMPQGQATCNTGHLCSVSWICNWQYSLKPSEIRGRANALDSFQPSSCIVYGTMLCDSSGYFINGDAVQNCQQIPSFFHQEWNSSWGNMFWVSKQEEGKELKEAPPPISPLFKLAASWGCFSFE